MSPGHDQDYFADGLTEELINQLAQIPVLRVAARTSSFVFKGKSEDLRSVGAKLGVSHVLEGSVRKSGDHVRITAQLIQCNDGFHLWSDRFDRHLTDIFAIQDDVSRAVANALGVTLGIGEVLRAPGGTKNVQAYDEYLRARSLYQQMGPAEMKRAEEIYREALALDPDFALAWHGLYYVYNDALTFLPDYAASAPVGMAEASARLQSLAPDAWWSHAVHAEQCIREFDWLGAESGQSHRALGARRPRRSS